MATGSVVVFILGSDLILVSPVHRKYRRVFANHSLYHEYGGQVQAKNDITELMLQIPLWYYKLIIGVAFILYAPIAVTF
jgi:hypothetical protein